MIKKRSITFNEALKTQEPLAFATMIKPGGSACNLNCQYCYYLDKSEIYGGKEPVMSYELLEIYIKQYIEANQIPVVTFIWHGGEPLILGIDYFRKAIELQKKYAKNKNIENVLQTNGVLVNDEWCKFFYENNFLIGVSIDGPRDIHDAFRVNKAGRGNFDQAMNAIELLKRYNVDYNTLSVVNSLCEGRGVEIYRFLKSIGSRYMQFLPVVEYVVEKEGSKRPLIVAPNTAGSALAEWSVSAKGYGQFLNDIFDEWVIQDVGNYFVQMFDVALAQWHGVPPGLCSFSETCGDALVVEHNGDVYSCDHFVYPEYKLGNISTDHLRDLKKSSTQFNFGINKRNTLPEECLKCKFYFACRGECPKHRFERSENGELNKNTLCEGLKMFFRHVDPYMKYMSSLLDKEQSPSFVIPWARQRIGLF